MNQTQTQGFNYTMKTNGEQGFELAPNTLAAARTPNDLAVVEKDYGS